MKALIKNKFLTSIFICLLTVISLFSLVSCNDTKLEQKQDYDMSGITFEDKTVTYDGNEHELTISGTLPEGVTVTYENNENINAGTYEVTAILKGNGYNTLTLKATLTINKADYDMSGITFEDKTVTYDGNEHELLIEGTLPEGVTVIYENNKLTEVGSVKATAIFSHNNPNYNEIPNMTATLTVEENPLYHTVKFIISDNEFKEVLVKEGEGVKLEDIPNIPSKTGYNGVWDKDISCITEDIEVYVKYIPKEYTITYICGDNGTNNKDNPNVYTIESQLMTLKDAIANNIGIIFDGWYTTPTYDAGTRVLSIETGSYGDLVLYAKWINYCVEYAEGSDIDYSMTKYELPAITTTVSSNKNLMTLSTLIHVSDGCTWELSKDIEGTDLIKTKNISLVTGHNIYYITVWYEDIYNLVYILDVYKLDNYSYTFISDGNIFIEEKYADEDTLIKEPENIPIKTGYTFVGWQVEGKIVEFPYELNKDTIFIAVFKANTYTITYIPNGGDIESLTQEVVFDQPYTLYDITRKGYTFSEYTYNGNTFESGIWNIDENITLEAKWEANTYRISYILGNEVIHYEDVLFDNNYKLYEYSNEKYEVVAWINNGNESSPNAQKTLDEDHDIVYIAKAAYIDDDFRYEISNNEVKITGYKGNDLNIIIPEYIKDNTSYYQVTSIGYNAFSGCSSLKSVTIPDSVTSIGDSAFSGCSSLTSLTIPEGVTSIGDSAFSGCSSLTSLTIPEGVTSIGSSAFYDCSSLESLTIPNSVTSIGYETFRNCTSLISVTIPEGVASIGESAFYNCYRLTSITIPEGVTSIGYETFRNCTSLTNVYITNIESWLSIEFIHPSSNPLRNGANLYLNNELVTDLVIPEGVTSIGSSAFFGYSRLISVTIPEGVASIGESAFYNCYRLTSITIPNSVTSIGDSAFYDCSSLKGVYITDIEAWLSIKFHRNLSNPLCNGANLYLNNELVTDLVLPEGITNIDAVFSGCSSLKSVTIPEGVASIGESAFYNCYRLTSITIPNSVTSIGDSAFSGCSSLKSVTIPEGVASIGESAFYACYWLTSITIPNSVTSIGDSAFYGCSSLDSVYITNIESWLSIEFIHPSSNPLHNGANLYLNNELVTDLVLPEGITNIDAAFSGCSSLKSVTIPEGVASIGDSAFYGCSSLESIIIPNSVTSIGERAFYKCSSLTSLTIPNSVTSIGYETFRNCTSLISVTIQKGVTSIGYSAFYGCSSLESIIIPNSVTSIGYETFRNCTNLISVTIQKGVTSIGDSAFYGCSSLESIIIPNSVTSIGDFAFYKCSSLTSLTIPDSVTSIGDSAFYGCSSLESIIIPNSVTSIGDSAFYNCSSLTSVTILEGVTSIGSWAFSGCSSLTSVTIPEGVTSIGDAAFHGCSSLDSVYITNIESWLSIEFIAPLSNPLRNGANLYLNNELVTDLVIPEGVTSIGSSAFFGYSRLISVTIPEGVTSIGERAFVNCSSLESIIIPNSVILIGEYAFSGCSSLTSVTIPEGVTSIGERAFSGCSKLNHIYYKGTADEWNNIDGSSDISNGIIYYYSQTEPITSGNYWHYDEDGITPVKWEI